jgi:hypothetical protein
MACLCCSSHGGRSKELCEVPFKKTLIPYITSQRPASQYHTLVTGLSLWTGEREGIRHSDLCRGHCFHCCCWCQFPLCCLRIIWAVRSSSGSAGGSPPFIPGPVMAPSPSTAAAQCNEMVVKDSLAGFQIAQPGHYGASGSENTCFPLVNTIHLWTGYVFKYVDNVIVFWICTLIQVLIYLK